MIIDNVTRLQAVLTYLNTTYYSQTKIYFTLKFKDNALEATRKESSNIINLVVHNNNGGKGVDQNLPRSVGFGVDIGGEVLKSTYSEKLLGLYINTDFK